MKRISYNLLVSAVFSCLLFNNRCSAQCTPPNVLFFVDTFAVCDFSNSVCFDNQSETGVGYTYNWDFGDGDTSVGSVFEPCHTYITDSVYSVTLTVTTGSSCVDSLTIVINTDFPLLPVVSLSSSVNNDTICDGDSITFLASDSGYVIQPVIYEFFIGATSVQAGPQNTFGTTTLVDGDTMTVILVNANGCESDTSNAIVTTVLSLPNVALTSSDSILCQGDNITFTASPAGLDSYLFYDSTTVLQNSSSNIYVTDSLRPGNIIFVVGVDTYGCVSPPSDTLTIPVKPTPAPSISSNIMGMGICIGDNATLTVTDMLSLGADYLWNTNDTTDSITIIPSVNTPYSVSATFDGCTGTDSIVVLVDVVPPTADAGSDITLCEDDSITLNASGGVSYNWGPAAGLSCTNCQSPVAIPISTITYSVTVTDTACFDTDEIIVTVESCIIDSIPQVITPNKDGDNDIFIIPNIDNFPDNKITIFNRWGNVVFNTNGYHNVNNSWVGTSKPNGGGAMLPDGTYYYILDIGNGTQSYTGFVMIHR